MDEKGQEQATSRLAGYAALVEQYDLDVIPNWHRSLVATSGIHRIDSSGGVIEEVYPPKYWPGNTLGDHLEFALKYDGTNLAILSRLFQEVAAEEFLGYVRSKPTGKYTRRLWFLSGSACRTMAGYQHANVPATLSFCRRTKWPAWSRLCNPPMGAISRTLPTEFPSTDRSLAF